ncbi:hypothetical protein Leryth_007742 [Lithospermum erythrorhizon]|nr:hypothetical protein Leryth_007742 [Lithospermum erythrorhizon]
MAGTRRQTSSGEEVTLLGDLVLSDKLIVYDVEKQTIGWTEYNCSSSIKVKDEQTGKVHSVVAHHISSSTCILQNGISIPFFLLIVVLWNCYKDQCRTNTENGDI